MPIEVAAHRTLPGLEFAVGNKAIPHFDIAGIDIAAIDIPRACEIVAEAAVSGRPTYVTVTGAHGVVESLYVEKVRRAHRAALMAVPDGMPLVWLGRLLGCRSIGRVYGPDLMLAMFSSERYRQLRHFFYGSSSSVVAALVENLSSRFGKINVAGSYCPPMKPLGFQEDDSILAFIREAKPDIIWVGLSTPKQELWLQTHMPKIGRGIGIGAGAAFELVSGTVTQAPRWIRRSGLEWLFRLVMEPRRLFKRYFFIVPRFAGLFLVRLLKPRTAIRAE